MELAERVVCDFYNISPNRLKLGDRRCGNKLILIRENLWYILKSHFYFRFTEIGERYGYDPNTILHGFMAVEAEISVYKFTDHPTKTLINLIRQQQ
jgi:chromosomal replication initiation ATPase DnaA